MKQVGSQLRPHFWTESGIPNLSRVGSEDTPKVADSEISSKPDVSTTQYCM